MKQATLTSHMEVLGVDWGASPDAVKAAWRQAAKSAHPDIAGHSSNDLMAQINAAYEVLKDGVPSRPAMTSVPGHAPLIVSKQQVDFFPDRRADMESFAKARLEQHGIDVKKPTLLKRLFNRKPTPAVLVPRCILAFNQAINIILADKTLPEGDNYIVLPEFRLEGGKIVETGKFRVVELTIALDDSELFLHPVQKLAKTLIPSHPEVKVFLSTLYFTSRKSGKKTPDHQPMEL
jgi:hypothetical protein